MPRATQVWKIFGDSFSSWNAIDAPRLGAALAYYTILSLAPLLVVVVGIAGLVFGRAAVEGQIVWEFQDTIGTSGAQVVQTMLQNAHKPAAGILAVVIGMVVLLFSASGVFLELRDSLNDVWGVRSQMSGGLSSMLRYRFHAFAMVVGIGFLLLVSLVVSAFLAAAGKFLNGLFPVPVVVLQAVNAIVSLIVITNLFALVYKVVPDVRITWRDVWIGAAVTAFLFELGKVLIGLYLGRAGVGSAYGAAGSLVVVLVWVYYSAQIFLLGAEFTHRFTETHGSHAPRRARTSEPIETLPAA
jgi:membrane protein